MDLYPPLSKELARKRAQLAPEISAAFKAFSQRVFAEGAAAHEDQAAHRRGGGARDPMSVLHSRPYRACAQGRRDATGGDGSDLGGRRNARGRRLRAFYSRA